MSKKYGYGRREGCKGAGEREKHLRGKLAHRGQTNRNFAAGGGKAVTVVRGPAVMGLFGKSGLQGLPRRVTLLVRDIRLRLSKGATGVSLFTLATWDSVAGPGRTPGTTF